jgi:hypothetical protein
VTIKKISNLDRSHTSITSLIGGRLGVLKPMSGDIDERCPLTADFGDMLLPILNVSKLERKIKKTVIRKYGHMK